jgi:hypothetical protein
VVRNKSKTKSAVESGHQENDSVYDFLYHDVRRVGSFLGQFDPNGHLQSLQTTAATGRSAESKADVEVSAGVPLVASAKGAHESKEVEHWDRAGQRTYDPLWGNALAFLDFLTQKDLISRDLGKSRIGKFVLSTGTLRVFDGQIAKNIFDSATIMQLASGMIPGPMQQAHAQGTESLRMLTPVIQATVNDRTNTVWMTLSPDSMITTPHDLALKHDIEIAGEWSVLGIVDALPDKDPLPVPTVIPPNDPAAMNAALASYNTNMAGFMALMNAIQARSFMGRPMGAFGITPLLIFREVSGG